jgi:hypothetical protein
MVVPIYIMGATLGGGMVYHPHQIEIYVMGTKQLYINSRVQP